MTPRWEHDARGKGGGFAALEALLRRVAGVSRLYWCNSPRLVAVRSRFGAMWAQRRLAWCVARMRTRYCVR